MDYSAFHWSEKARKYAETIGTIFNVKGRVNTTADLPSTGNKVGDLWLVGLATDPDLIEYAWLSFDNVTRWEKLGSTATSLAFSAITGSPNDNVALKNALDGKYSTSNPNGYISGITSAMVTTALGYTPYNSTNPSGYISGITSLMVTTALGYTPQQQLVSGTNIKTVNSQSLLGSGNLDIDGLPSQTGNAGKFLTTDGTDASWGVPKTHNLFDFIWRDAELNDQSWLRADTFSWQNGTVYSNAYNHLVADYNGGTSQTETVGSYTITYVLATDGHKITTDETNVANIYNESGVAWYYILDLVNQRFKLPRTKYGIVGLRDEVNKYVPESLPNISGTFNFDSDGNNALSKATSLSGAFTKMSTGSIRTAGSVVQANQPAGIKFNASDSSSVYQNNAPVQQRATQMYLYFYVGQFSQSATEQTAGLNSELFNGKADIDMGNVPSNIGSTAKSYFAGIGMPSDKYEDVTLLAPGQTYTAPANGYFCLATAYDGYHYITVDSDTKVGSIISTSNGTIRANVPVKKGDSVYIEYNTYSSYNFRFVYAVGSESEAS